MKQNSHDWAFIKSEEVNGSVRDLFLLFQQEAISIETLVAGLHMIEAPLLKQVPNYVNDYPYKMWFHFSLNGICYTIYDIERAFTHEFGRDAKIRCKEAIAEGCHGLIRVYVS